MSRSALFLDKDGVLVSDDGFPAVIPRSTLYEGIKPALPILKKLEIPVIVVSNQAWISQNRMTVEDADEVFALLKKNVEAAGGKIDHSHYCPHSKKIGCKCRKPNTGMLETAAELLDLDLAKCTIIGDSTSDIECGRRAGMRTVLVQSGRGGRDGEWDVKPTHTFDDLGHALRILYDTAPCIECEDSGCGVCYDHARTANEARWFAQQAKINPTVGRHPS